MRNTDTREKTKSIQHF